MHVADTNPDRLQVAWALGIQSDRLYMTYFGGDSIPSLEADQEAEAILTELGLARYSWMLKALYT